MNLYLSRSKVRTHLAVSLSYNFWILRCMEPWAPTCTPASGAATVRGEPRRREATCGMWARNSFEAVPGWSPAKSRGGRICMMCSAFPFNDLSLPLLCLLVSPHSHLKTTLARPFPPWAMRNPLQTLANLGVVVLGATKFSEPQNYCKPHSPADPPRMRQARKHCFPAG